MTIAIEPGHTLNVSQAKDFGTHTTKLIMTTFTIRVPVVPYFLQPKGQIACEIAKMANLEHL